MIDEWTGDERRKEGERRVCAVHNIKCQQWSAIEEDAKTRVPIWIFRFSLIIIIGISSGLFSFIYWAGVTQNAATLARVDVHIAKSNTILENLNRGLGEVSLNQALVLDKLDMTLKTVPDYDK